jgi:fructose-bisphosphate aldolase class II
MPLVNVSNLLKDAQDHNYAVPGFNCFNAESIEAVVECAQEERSGLIVQFHPSYFKHVSIQSLSTLTLSLARSCDTPVALALDHGSSEQDVLMCVRNGFTGVMIDGAELPFAENVELVRRIVDICHPLDISVEGAIGHMPHGRPQTEADYATEKNTMEFVQGTGVDAVAPAVGNVHGSAHGQEKMAPHLDFGLISHLSKAAKKPLVLHGGSSISEPDLRKAIASGIRKVVIFSDLANAFNASAKKLFLESSAGRNPIEILTPAKQALKEEARRKIHFLGSQGRY